MAKKKAVLKIILSAALLCSLAFTLYHFSRIAYAIEVIEAGVVKVVPSSIPLKQTGTWFIINVTVENAPPVFAVQVELEYDPTVLNATNVIQGTFLNSTGVQTFSTWNKTVHEEAAPPYAIITYAEVMLGMPTNLPQGSGLLCRINFTILTGGVSRLELLPYAMVDSKEVGVFFIKLDFTRPDPKIRVKPTALSSGFYGSALVLRVDKAQISEGENFNLTCTLYPELVVDKTPPYAANITVQYKKGEESWRKIDSKNVNVPDLNEVSVSFIWQKPGAGDYKVKAIATIGDEVLESNELLVKVKAVAVPWWQSPMFIAAIVIIVAIIVAVVLVKRRGGKAKT
ncbi:MAG: cohesin domain-containing protein [archaeon YNP-WB-062]|jgi:hypothetical protein|nr:cohesin domain-containing protein [Candidatus Culexarchaeum yellowstonense]